MSEDAYRSLVNEFRRQKENWYEGNRRRSRNPAAIDKRQVRAPGEDN